MDTMINLRRLRVKIIPLANSVHTKDKRGIGSKCYNWLKNETKIVGRPLHDHVFSYTTSNNIVEL
jgi:hypothetical protein